MTTIDPTATDFTSSLPLHAVVHSSRHAAQERAVRVLNVIVAALGLIVTAPLMAVVAVLVRATSKGPVFYRQTRIGRDRRAGFGGNHRRQVDMGGKPFTIYKFRTMAVTESSQRMQCWASPDDPRVTRVGRVLRKFRLDELPQLYNVLTGDMNVVGPRPEQPAIFASLRDQIPGYHLRQRVPPGITGWAQVNQHYDTSVDDVKRKVAFDLEYVQRRSVGEDLKIMLKTFPTIAFRRGAW